jgi:PAS domain S-box-containing protein
MQDGQSRGGATFLPIDEPRRLAALRRVSILDSAPEEAFDRLARLAAFAFDAPIALVSFVDADRIWIKAGVGLYAPETPRQLAFCAHAILGDGVCLVADSALDPRFAGNPLACGEPSIRFYAGAPLTTRDGLRLGTLCVMDHQPRSAVSSEQSSQLSDLAAIVVEALEQRERKTAAEHVVSHFHELCDVSPAMVWTVDEEFRCTYVSRAWLQFKGAERKSELGDGWMRGVHPEDVGELKRLVEEAFARREELSLQYRIRSANGDYRWVLDCGKPRYDPAGRFLGYVGSCVDVTEIREKDRALGDAHALASRAEQSLAAAIDSMSNGIALFNAEDRLVICNEAYRSRHAELSDILHPGIRFEDIVRANVARSRFDLGGEAAETYVQRRLAQHLAASGPIERRLADGRWEEARDELLSDGGRMLTISEITERKKAEEALREAKAAAEAANHSKSQFLANMSHELRTPLNAINGFSEIIGTELLGPAGNSRYAEYARDILSSGQHLLELINDILDLSKIDAGKLELAEEEVDVAYAIETALVLVRGKAVDNGVSLTIHESKNLPALRADRRALRQILVNLLSNAVKFTPTGGDVAVRVWLAADRRMHVEVSDTGIGMRAEDIPRALEPFQQIDGAVSRKHEGTGLGLPLCKRLIELHGGALLLDSAPSVGTKATIVFPADRSASPEQQRCPPLTATIAC